ncbi:SDR family NAD(P)-dependent oxidoreductase [Miniimonas sp. S16]|uniref:SDR family NAD(P)-dependent oxidoreductase n=1 Tax=Miniimonas sp. S16 TaxID=2171623 RepID=UPI000D5274C6|nr:SDR family oxidoreductase [Miniimonas sp. S16]
MTEQTSPPRAVVTGASTGIGAATVRALREQGWDVLATARRTDRLEALAQETGCAVFAADLTDPAQVAALAARATAGGPLRALVNNAGGAIGLDPVADADVADWLGMYEMNVLATLRLTQALLPALESDDGGDLVFVTSTAAHGAYPGGGGYTGAKRAEREIALTLRQELVGRPVRIIEIAPGMVKTEEFALNRFDGDAERAERVYAGVDEPLVAADIADAIAWTLTRPAHVNVDLLMIRPVAQATNTLVARSEGP